MQPLQLPAASLKVSGSLACFAAAVVLEPEINDLNQGFSIDNDCLTPTFKLKRPQLLRRYQTQIDEMYISLGQDPSKNKI